jgi:hypothetical protein
MHNRKFIKLGNKSENNFLTCPCFSYSKSRFLIVVVQPKSSFWFSSVGSYNPPWKAMQINPEEMKT